MTGSYQDQVRRVARSYQKLPTWSFILTPDEATDEVLDAYIHFFQDCHHLKDWIKNDNEVNADIRKKVEGLITNSEALTYIASIADATKHLVLTRNNRNKKDIEIKPDEMSGFGGKKYFLQVKSAQEHKAYEAYALATFGIEEWCRFLKENGLETIKI